MVVVARRNGIKGKRVCITRDDSATELLEMRRVFAVDALSKKVHAAFAGQTQS